MSITIYKSDVLNATISAGSYGTPEIEGDENSKHNISETIELNISILVNGKLKSIYQMFNVIKKNNGSKGLSDKDIKCFCTLTDTIKQIGYDINPIYKSFFEGVDTIYN